MTQAISLQPAELTRCRDTPVARPAAGCRWPMPGIPSRTVSSSATSEAAPGQRTVRDLALSTPEEPVPSLAGVSPAVELVRTRDHRSVRVALSRSPAAASAASCTRASIRISRRSRQIIHPIGRFVCNEREAPFRNWRAPRPTCSCCRSVRCAPTCVESAEFLFFYVGEAILHYHPRLVLQTSRHGEAVRGS